MQDIHVVAATNDNYAKHLAIMLNSLLHNKKATNPIYVYVIYGQLSSESKKKLRKAVEKFLVNIEFLKVDPSIYRNFGVWGYGSIEVYYRLSMAELLSNKVSKVIYLDCDIIVRDDIIQLWNVNVSNHFLAAVEDVIGDWRFKDLSIPSTSRYFNSGVLVVNLEKWRECGIAQQVIEFIKNNHSKIIFWDQDGLNAILHDKWLKLDSKWNYQAQMGESLNRNPSIIHYTTDKKPWNSDTPFKEEYLKYANRTLWDCA